MADLEDDVDEVTDSEAREILSRFNASHWNNPGERARYSIPANPRRDDDIRLGAYIEQTKRMRARLAQLEAFRAEVEDVADHLRYLSAAPGSRAAGTYAHAHRLLRAALERVGKVGGEER